MASRFWVGGTGTWDASDTTHWSASSGGAGGASVPVDGDTVTLDGSSGGGTVTLGYSPTVTSISCGAFTGTLNFSTYSPTMNTFDYSGTAVRTIALGSGTWTIRGNAATVWSGGTTTNLTLTGSGVVNFTYSGSSGVRGISPSSSPIRDSTMVFNITAGSDTISTGNSTPGFYSLNFTGFSGAWQNGSSTSYTFKGSLIMSSTMTNNVTSAINFTGTKGTQTITSNTKTFASAITFNGSGGNFVLGDNFSTSSTITLTAGTFSANNFNVTCTTFSSSNSNTRTLTMGSGTWTLTGNAATIWNTATTTNLTFNGNTATVNYTYSGGTGTRTINSGSSAVVLMPTMNVTAGTDSFTLTGSVAGNVNFTGFTGAFLLSGSASFGAHVTFGTGMTTTASGSTLTLGNATVGSYTLTTNGVALLFPITINKASASWILADNLDMSSAGSSRNLTLTNGELDTNNKNISVPIFNSSNSNTRVLTLGSSTITLTGTGTVWTTATSTNLTLNRGTSTIKISDTSATAKTFSGGGKTFYNLWYANGAGGASLTFVGSNTFNSVRDTSTAAHSLIFTAGTTQTVPIGSWFVTGKSGAVTTLASTTTSAFTLTFTGVGTISSDYMSISYCTISLPDKEFFVGTHSTDGGNNTRVYFTAPTLHRSNFYLFM